MWISNGSVLRERHDLRRKSYANAKTVWFNKFRSRFCVFATGQFVRQRTRIASRRAPLIWRKSWVMKLIQRNAAPAPASRQPQGPWHQRHHEARQRLRRTHLSRDLLRPRPARKSDQCTSSSSPPTGPASSHGLPTKSTSSRTPLHTGCDL